MDDKQLEFFNKARKGVLKHLNEKGGTLNLADLHDYCMNKFFIQHQGFSRMMETFVDEGLVFYDQPTQDVTISDVGREFSAK